MWQINLYVPEVQHDGFGIVRSLVVDTQDNATGAAAQTFLDSDGQVGNSSSRDASPYMDGRWHMVRALSTSVCVDLDRSALCCPWYGMRSLVKFPATSVAAVLRSSR